jgi:SAM-dependent methyltransferase
MTAIFTRSIYHPAPPVREGATRREGDMTKKPQQPRPVDPRAFEVDRALLHRGGAIRAWGNLGDWTTARTYAEACQALALRVGRAADLREGDFVLEAASGGGEGLFLWLGRFEVERATGVELHPAYAAASRTLLGGVVSPDRWRVYTGSATDLSVFADAAFDAVVCVDAAYHFDPRARFFAEARRVLRPGGRLALTDLVLAQEPRGAVSEAALEAAARACAIPRVNLVTEAAYADAVRAAGFVGVAIERLDDEVLGGFAAFVRAHRRAHLSAFLGAGGAKVLVTGWAADLARRRGWAGYVLVSARVP